MLVPHPEVLGAIFIRGIPHNITDLLEAIMVYIKARPVSRLQPFDFLQPYGLR